MTNPRPAQRWSITKPSPLVLLALPCALAFFQPPPAALSTLGKTSAAARRGSLAATWPATGGGDSAVSMAAVGRRRRTVLFGKSRKKRKGAIASQDSPSWFDDDEEDAVVEDGGGDGDGVTAPTTAAAAAAATERGASSARPPTATASFNDGGPASNSQEDSPSTSTTTPVADDDLLPADLDDLDDDANQIVLEPVWVEGETQGEKPIVETYGLNDALATAQDGIDLDNGMMIDTEDEEALLIPADGVLPGGLADGVGPESWRNGMEVPDDDVMLGERFNMVGRGLDDMLMERSIRFYDPKVDVSPVLFCFF